MQHWATRLLFALAAFSMFGCDREPAALSRADLAVDYAHCWPHVIMDRREGTVRLEVLGIYVPDLGVLALSGTCPQGASLGWTIRDYETDPILKKLDGLLGRDRLGPNMAGFRASVVGHFEISTGHLGLEGLSFQVDEWKLLEAVPPELADRLGDRFDRGEGPI